MENLNFFKQQAKNFLKDYNSRVFNENEGYYDYNPRFFDDIDDIIYEYNIDEEKKFTLMNAQHVIAKLSGFNKWNELIKASDATLEIAKNLFLNRESGMWVDDWKLYEERYLSDIDDESKLKIFRENFLKSDEYNEKASSRFNLDLSNKENAQDMISQIIKQKNISPEKAITSSITQKNFIRILETGWGPIALSIWGHDDPYREKNKLDNPNITFRLNKSKKRLIEIVMEREKSSLEETIFYFVLFELENLGYHI